MITEENLVIDQDYYLDSTKENSGRYKNKIDGVLFFERTSGEDYLVVDENDIRENKNFEGCLGYIGFIDVPIGLRIK